MDYRRALNGWTPLRLIHHPEPALEWFRTGCIAFREPFFEDTVTRAFRNPWALLVRRKTTLAELGSALTDDAVLRPAGFIFHVSRCGSTLISRSLAALPQLRVYSEPSVIDAVLQSGLGDDEVRTAILALCLKWNGEPGRTGVVIKFDCWNLGSAERIARLFPATPRIFVFREPLEVLMSQARQPGAWTIPGAIPPALLGMPEQMTTSLQPDEYCARALAHFMTLGADLISRGVVVPVNYTALPAAIVTVILPLFGITMREEERELLTDIAKAHSKRPYESFSGDPASDPSAAMARLSGLAQAITAESWHKMQQIIVQLCC